MPQQENSTKTFCAICSRIITGSLARHVSKAHNILAKEYYDAYLIRDSEGKCSICGNPTRFVKLSMGYEKKCRACNYKSAEALEKRKNTNLKKYGVENISQLEYVKEKKRGAYLEAYGVSNPMLSPHIIKNRETSFHSAHGMSNPSSLPSVKEKKRQKYLSLYGVDNPAKSPEILNKKTETMISKYGVAHPLQSPEILERTKQTNSSRYGADNPSKNEHVKNKQIIAKRISFYNKLMNSERLSGLVKPLFSVDEYITRRVRYYWQCVKCNNIFEDCIDNGQIPRCVQCFPKLAINKSKGEKEIFDFIKSVCNTVVIENDRTVLNGKELDIYIPDKKLAIEYNGLYWHSELSGKLGKHYHYNKTKECADKGIQLLHIFEDEWDFKRAIVKSIILNKLGLIDTKLYARRCSIEKVSNDESEVFLEDNHLQGGIKGQSYGLHHLGKLVCIAVVGKPRFDKKYNLELLRFCNSRNTIVIGGLSRLVKHALKDQGATSLVTYCDLRYSSGGGYTTAGFRKISNTIPSYYYIIDNIRYNRLSFQKKYLSEKLEEFDDALTEWENMQINGYDRIWDCGNSKYSIVINR